MSSMKKQKSVRMSGKLERGNTSKKILTTEESAALLKAKKLEKAILPIQMMIRRKLARARVKRLMEKNFERVFDPKLGLYFWYNRTTGQSQWKTPLMLSLHSVRDHKAATRIQRIVRGFIGRFRARKVAALKYTRFYDAKTDKFYFMLNSSKKTFWKASPWLKRMNIPMPPEDQMLFESQLKIKELESLLKMKDEEIAEVRQKRFEELEPEVIKDKVANARGGPRSKHMDEWSVDDLAGWFAELRFDQYIPTIYSHKIDGLLFLNLLDEDWPDMGITNKFHTKKLQLILKSYRARYQRRLQKKKDLAEEDDVSDYAPSELSDILAQESGSGSDQDNGDQGEADDDVISSTSSDEEEEVEEGITEEERIERALDKRNLKLEIKAKGDGENYPIIGDIVRVRYTCMLPDGKVISSTKHSMGRDSIEFVLGIDQVVKGFDRGLMQISIGERTLITCTPEYGYGKEGIYALVPPDSHLIFDVTLLGFRPREAWIKPLIQAPGFSEKPYIDKNLGNAFDRGNTIPDSGSVVSKGSTSMGTTNLSHNSLMMEVNPDHIIKRTSASAAKL